MTYVHELPDWPRLHWDSESLTTLLAKVRHQQGKLLGKMSLLGFEECQQASYQTLTENILNSSAIEGEQLNAAEVRSSLARRLGLEIAGLPAASRHIDGIVEMMLDATRQYQQPVTEQRLFGWHAALFPTGYSGTQQITVGHWRPATAGEMQVISGHIGKERVHFQAPEAERLALEMQQLLHWINQPQPIDPLLMAGIAHFWFVTIHPFEDGNGRIARALADLFLARADAVEHRFYSMSSQIAAERRDYYQELELAQRSDLDISRWLEWFLQCLGRAIESAENHLTSVIYQSQLWQRINQHSINTRQRTILQRLMNNFEGYLTTSKYAKIAKCSTDTALRDIQELVRFGILLQNPNKGRSTSYRLAERSDKNTPESNS